MEQPPVPLDYAPPPPGDRRARWFIVGVVVLVAIGLIAALFATVQTPVPVPMPTVAPPGVSNPSPPPASQP